MRRWRMFLLIVSESEETQKTIELTKVVGRYPESKDSEPSSDTENRVARVKEASEIDESTKTLTIRFAARLACGDT